MNPSDEVVNESRPAEFIMQAYYAELHVGVLSSCQGDSLHEAPVLWLHDQPLLHDPDMWQTQRHFQAFIGDMPW